MTTEQEEFTLRFHVGKFEQQVIYLILILQVTLAAMACFVTYWFIHVTINAHLNPERPTLMYAEWMLYPIGAAVAIYILNRLYE